MSDVIQIDPEILSGMPTFKGTRVPIKNLFDYYSKGHTIDEFLEDFPSVSKNQVLELLQVLQNQALKIHQPA